MSAKRIVPHALANRDIDEAIAFYLAEAGTKVALEFIDALERAYRHIAQHPESASLRYAHELDLPGLRCWPLRGYPHLIFFIEHEKQIDVWRVLHGAQDIPAWMHES